MAMTHTPGPWELHSLTTKSGKSRYGLSAPSMRICDIPVYNDTDESNARLIAAAPDLLAACKGMLRALTDDSVSMVDRINAAADAIAKATGAEGR